MCMPNSYKVFALSLDVDVDLDLASAVIADNQSHPSADIHALSGINIYRWMLNE